MDRISDLIEGGMLSGRYVRLSRLSIHNETVQDKVGKILACRFLEIKRGLMLCPLEMALQEWTGHADVGDFLKAKDEFQLDEDLHDELVRLADQENSTLVDFLRSKGL